MEHRVKRAGAHIVAVMREFLDHPFAIELSLGSVMEDMQADEAGQYFVVIDLGRHDDGYRISISELITAGRVLAVGVERQSRPNLAAIHNGESHEKRAIR